ncbi:M23 family metallopeptidase [Actinomyces sp. 594]|nr:M23 family metallopeptidase [Actinomyces sp. 594]NDR53863.1 M23 family metallopeptidase [Actinomyces sp. 565]
MTRRQRRDAERAAEREREPGAQSAPPVSPAPAPQESTPAPVQVDTYRSPSGVGMGARQPGGRRYSYAGTVGRLGVLAVLALVTVVAPLTLSLPTGPQAVAALGASSTNPTGVGTTDPSSSIAAAVLGSDADVDTDSELSNVPDAATLARIREAYENASATCAAQTSGASGDTAAFNSAPELFYPMIEGTYTVSSPYGYRLHPTLGYMKLHAGQDYAASAGTPIYAVAAGTVVEAGMSGSTGTVTIEHELDGETWYTSYLHMYEDGIYVSKGDQVEAGQLIAGVGSTGYSTGPHLHFEVRTANNTEDSSTVDPEEWLAEHTAVELTTDCA